MVAVPYEMISEISANLAKLLGVIGVIFVFFKLNDKLLQNQTYSTFYQKIKLPFYQIHVNGTKIAIILAFVHGFTVKPINQSYIITGWLLGITMLLLLVLGVLLSIKNKSKPMETEEDLEWKTIRIIKWILTACALLFLFLHYLPMIREQIKF